MEFTTYLYFLFFFLFFKNFEISFLFVLFKVSSPQHGQSPLTLACIHHHVDIAKLLLQNGAHLIVQVCWFFLNNFPQNNPLFSSLSFFSFFQFTINLVLEKQGKSILHQVCGSYSVNLRAVKLLVENGADVNEIYQVFSNLIFFEWVFLSLILIIFFKGFHSSHDSYPISTFWVNP